MSVCHLTLITKTLDKLWLSVFSKTTTPLPSNIMASPKSYHKTYIPCTISLEYSIVVKKPQIVTKVVFAPSFKCRYEEVPFLRNACDGRQRQARNQDFSWRELRINRAISFILVELTQVLRNNVAFESLVRTRGGYSHIFYYRYTGVYSCTRYGFQAFLSRAWGRKHNVLGQEQGVKLKRV